MDKEEMLRMLDQVISAGLSLSPALSDACSKWGQHVRAHFYSRCGCRKVYSSSTTCTVVYAVVVEHVEYIHIVGLTYSTRMI